MEDAFGFVGWGMRLGERGGGTEGARAGGLNAYEGEGGDCACGGEPVIQRMAGSLSPATLFISLP